MARPPSPVKHTTGRSRWITLAAIAAGSEKPIEDRPLVMRVERGEYVSQPWPTSSLCEPTSAVAIASRGAARRTASITSVGLRRPATRPS